MERSLEFLQRVREVNGGANKRLVFVNFGARIYLPSFGFI